MISLDTNVLVRFLLDASESARVDADHVAQRKAAQRLIHRALAEGTPIFLATTVLCEFVWVLRIFYKVRKPQILGKLDELVAASEVVLQDRAMVLAAIERFRVGRADFADYLIAESSAASAASPVFTFDEKALRSAGFKRPA